MIPVYEDNHVIIVQKESGEIVQGDKTGDKPLSESVKEYIKEAYAKPGNVFCGVVHRIDRPVSGLVVFARTSKALSRLNDMFREGKVRKTYLAVVQGKRKNKEDLLTHFICSSQQNNKSYISETEKPGYKKSQLKYRVLGEGENYSLLEVELLTGRKHQIRAQLAYTGTPIKGDLKYGAKRSNPDGSISLVAYHVEFIHPVSGKLISVYSSLPDDKLWHLVEIPGEVKSISAGEA